MEKVLNTLIGVRNGRRPRKKVLNTLKNGFGASWVELDLVAGASTWSTNPLESGDADIGNTTVR
jgi:hypothetical protein